MGDRVSIRFVNSSSGGGFGTRPEMDCPVIFCHWGGTEFVEAAVKYSLDLIAERKGSFEPLDRLEARTVTCDFLFNIDKYYHISGSDHRISHDIYIGRDENDGDNGDNGHFNIDLGDVEKLAKITADIADRYSTNNEDWN